LFGFRRTQYIPELGGFYKNRGFYLEVLGEGVIIEEIEGG
jgi:hypothetical protein